MIKLIKTESSGNFEQMEFRVDSAVKGGFTNTVPMHPTEAGVSVSDHVTHEMDKVAVTIILGVVGDVSVSSGYKFLKDALDDGSIVHVNLNYYNLKLFSETIIETLGVVVGSRILTCEVVFSEIRRVKLETKDVNVVQDKSGDILYYPVVEARATESLIGTSSMTPHHAMQSLIESAAGWETTPLPETAPGKSFSFKSMPFIAKKRFAVTFPDASEKSVTFLFKPSRTKGHVVLSIYWQTGECPMMAGARRCVGFSGLVSKLSTIKVTHPSTDEHVFTVFIRDFDITTSGAFNQKYLSADIWIEDMTYPEYLLTLI